MGDATADLTVASLDVLDRLHQLLTLDELYDGYRDELNQAIRDAAVVLDSADHQAGTDQPDNGGLSSDDSDVKRCPRCETVKSHDEFGRNRSTHDGLQSWCKACVRDYNRRSREQPARGDTKPTAAAGSDAPATSDPAAPTTTPASPKNGQTAKSSSQTGYADPPAPIPAADPIDVTVTCPAHGDVSRERHDGSHGRAAVARAAAGVNAALHQASGCTHRCEHTWQPADATTTTPPAPHVNGLAELVAQTH